MAIDFFIETSAFEGRNTKELFDKAAKMLYIEYMKFKTKVKSKSTYSSNIYTMLSSKNKLDMNNNSEESEKDKKVILQFEVENNKTNKSECPC